MRLLSPFAMAVALLISAPTAPVVSAGAAGPAAKDPAPALATLARSGCYGFCPIYKVSVYADGHVTYDGERFVAQVGHRTSRVSTEAIRALRKAFAKAEYLSLSDHYDCVGVTDMPSATTSYAPEGTPPKTVTHYFGCEAAPKALFDVEDAIDRAAGVERWVGTRKQREALRTAGKFKR